MLSSSLPGGKLLFHHNYFPSRPPLKRRPLLKPSPLPATPRVTSLKNLQLSLHSSHSDVSSSALRFVGRSCCSARGPPLLQPRREEGEPPLSRSGREVLMDAGVRSCAVRPRRLIATVALAVTHHCSFDRQTLCNMHFLSGPPPPPKKKHGGLVTLSGPCE